MKAAWALVTGPTIEPITIDEAKAQARNNQSQSDGEYVGFIAAACDAAEQAMSRGILTQTWRLDLDAFYDEMPLPMAAPLQNNALASPSTAPLVQYYATDGTLTTLSSSVYVVDTTSRPGRIVRAPGMAWPAVQADRPNGAVRITYVVGWLTAADVPERIKQGIRMYVTYLDADRDGMDTQAMAAEEAALRCWSDRVYWVEPACA